MIRLYVAASLDGFIADADGGVGWLDPFNSPDTTASYESFIAQIGTIVMGRRRPAMVYVLARNRR